MEAMQIQAKLIVTTMLFGLAVCCLWAQGELRHGRPSSAGPSNAVLHNVGENQGRDTNRVLDQNDRLSLIAAALDARVRRNSEPDCSHLVHAIYERAGFPYAYAPSSELYSGVERFQRVKLPEPGDLVVWRGHAGIVIKPSQHIFFSFMRSGPGIDDYQAPYWKSRGRPRFYRYVKNDSCAGCDSVRLPPRQLVKIKK
jgi:cell wall-associated NlpC family hydrolase